MAKKQAKELVQTTSKFKLQGKVTRADKEHAYTEGVGKEGTKNEGKPYRSLRLGVQTSEENEIFVQMFSFEPEQVFLWNSEKSKEAKEKGGKYKGMRMDYADFLDEREDLREEGHALLESHVSFGTKTIEKDGKEKEVMDVRGELKYHSAKLIHEHVDNGDSVIVEGNISYSTYTNPTTGEERLQTNYNIERFLVMQDDIDFEDEKFEEISYFEQEMVVIASDEDKKSGKTYVTGRMINYNKSVIDAQFVINTKDDEGEEDKDLADMAKAFVKQIKPYDKLKVYGDVLNRTIVKEVAEDEKEKTSGNLGLLGGKAKPKHAESYSAKSYQQELSITGVEEWEKKFYTEADFDNAEATVIKKETKKDDEGSFGKKKKTNPFAKTEDVIDLDDDDLPF